MKRGDFFKISGLLTAGLITQRVFSHGFAISPITHTSCCSNDLEEYPSIIQAVNRFKAGVKDKELAELFEYCIQTPLQYNIFLEDIAAKPYTFVVDTKAESVDFINSSIQMAPYCYFIHQDEKLKRLVAGVLNFQKDVILNEVNYKFIKEGPLDTRNNDNGLVHVVEEKITVDNLELDMLAFHLHLAGKYWAATHDTSFFDESWKQVVTKTLSILRQRQVGKLVKKGAFSNERIQAVQSYALTDNRYTPQKTGMISSLCRADGTCTIYPYAIPSNLFARKALEQASLVLKDAYNDKTIAKRCSALSNDITKSVKKFAVLDDPQFGKIYEYELNGSGSYVLMDDAHVPNFLSLPYLQAVDNNDYIYLNTRKMILSQRNPYFLADNNARAIGSASIGMDIVTPLSVIIEGLSSTTDDQIKHCIESAKVLMLNSDKSRDPKTFHKRNFEGFPSGGFSLYAELLWRVFTERPHILV